MKFRKILLSFLVLSLTIPSTLANIPLSVQAEEAIEIDAPDVSYTRDSETGHISLPLDSNPYPEKDSDLPTPHNSTRYAALPASYHPYETVISMYPGTRDQNPYGSCWAFSSVACAEFDLITEGTFPNNNITNFSELQLIYNMYHSGNDLLGNLDGDSCTLASNATKNYLDIGGNITYAQHILANWKGLTHEDNLPYSSAASTLSSGLSSNVFSLNNMARLENTRLLDVKSNPNAVKQAIMKHGAVSASYYHDSSYYSASNGYALYYCPYDYETNHAVCIVGWDDNFSASRWPSGKNPATNGAWLIRNSWSTKTTGSEYTYFWMSYADASLANAVWSLDFTPGDTAHASSYNYDNIYQHDGSPYHGWLTANKASNIFTARNYYASSKGSKSETLDAVMLTFMRDTNVNLKIEIYTGLSNRSNPESGTLYSQATTTFTTDYKGIYTIPLRKPVPLLPGQTYSIVVTALDGSADFDIESSVTASGWFTAKASIDANESFYKSRASSAWTDVSNYATDGFGNLCIKGLTKNCYVGTYTINYNLNGGTKTDDFPTSYTSNSGTISLPTPTRSGYHFLGWYTDSSFTNKISTISGNMEKNLTLYAKWGAHSYTTEVIPATLTANGSSKQSCSCGYEKNTTIYRPSTSNIKLSYTSTSYTGSAKTPSVTVTDVEGNTLTKNTDYTVTYSNNVQPGTATVTIDFINKYSGSYSKTFVINKAKLKFTKVTLSCTSYTYNGSYRKPTVSVYDGKTKLATKYYSVAYKNNKNVGTATVTITGKGKYKEYENTRTFKINPKPFTKVTLSSNSYAYNGNPKKPTVKVYNGSTRLSTTYYKVAYSNNRLIGKATVTITGTGKYSNYKSVKTFKINPAKQTILYITTQDIKGNIYGYHRVDSSCTGYQTQISTSKSFKQVLVKLNTTSNTLNAWKFYNLKSKKTYYIRTRSYKKVNGVTYYGNWSNVKSIKTK